jgi:hypothetical protein
MVRQNGQEFLDVLMADDAVQDTPNTIAPFRSMVTFAKPPPQATNTGNPVQENRQVFIDALMASDAINEIPNALGMRVIYSLPLLIPRTKSLERHDVVIRPLTEAFWSACVQLALEGSGHVCAVGTPGIGKSASIPYLIYLLLSMKRAVVFLLRTNDKTNWYYEFTSTPQMPSPYSCQIHPEATVHWNIPSLQDPEAFCIIDPGATSDSCNPGALAAKLIIVSSPDSKRWGGSAFSKIGLGYHGGQFLYYPLWSLDELLAVRSVLNQQVTEEQVRQRYYNVGGVPRDVFYGYETALSEQDSAVAALTEFQATRYLRDLAYGVVTMDRERPNARLLGLTSSEETGFRSYVTIPISSGVATKILPAFPYVVWELMALVCVPTPLRSS